MKNINVTFEDDDHARLSELKGKHTSWRDFILKLAKIRNER